MTQINYSAEIERYEQEVIDRFREEIDLTRLSNTEFENILLQKRLFSLEFFERFYNTTLCSLENEEAKAIARGIIRDEYPEDMPNHREDAVYDLIQIGLDKDTILRTELTAGTKATIDAMLGLVKYNHEPHYDMRSVTALRVAGEVLAGEELEIICEELERRYGLTKEKSAFYWPHVEHDKKTGPVGYKGTSHSDRFGELLAILVKSETDLEIVKSTIDDSYKARSKFWKRFAEDGKKT